MPKGIPLTQNELEQRRQEIFDATVNLFLEKGFYETSMREVAEAAGIGKSTLYDYFPSKDEIIVYAGTGRPPEKERASRRLGHLNREDGLVIPDVLRAAATLAEQPSLVTLEMQRALWQRYSSSPSQYLPCRYLSLDKDHIA